MKLLSVDVGTTSCKAALFDTAGNALRLDNQPTPTRTSTDGYAYYNPDELCETVCTAMRKVIAETALSEIALAGITSMAESGVLIDRKTGTPRSHFIPWFDMQAAPHAEFLARQDDRLARFCKTGIHPSSKVSLAKLLWLRQRDPGVFEGALWLSAADYIAYRLTGQIGTDYSLAGRTFAFLIGERRWDEDWIRALNLPPDIFPPPHPSGEPVGRVHADGQRHSGLPVGTPVAIAGHDHICGALAAGAVTPQKVFNSMGTAEVLLGTLDPRPLTQADFASGLSFGCHVVPGCNYWLGGLSASGGSIEWLREIFGKDQLSYRQIDELLEPADYAPVNILYFPYLLGSSSSSLNRTLSTSRAAFIGLDARHRQIDLFKAVLQGTAYEMERIRRTAEQLTASTIERMLAAGGGTRNKYWMQMKADVSNCILEISPFTEVTLLGAAMVAGMGAGVFSSTAEAISAMVPKVVETFLPDADRHRQHERLYEEGYLVLQKPLNHYYSTLDRMDNS